MVSVTAWPFSEMLSTTRLPVSARDSSSVVTRLSTVATSSSVREVMVSMRRPEVSDRLALISSPRAVITSPTLLPVVSRVSRNSSAFSLRVLITELLEVARVSLIVVLRADRVSTKVFAVSAKRSFTSLPRAVSVSHMVEPVSARLSTRSLPVDERRAT